MIAAATGPPLTNAATPAAAGFAKKHGVDDAKLNWLLERTFYHTGNYDNGEVNLDPNGPDFLSVGLLGLGGALANRLRYPIEVLMAMRAEFGEHAQAFLVLNGYARNDTPESFRRLLSGIFRGKVEARELVLRAADGREFLLTGDLNVAHAPADVANWRRSNQVEGFLPEEREWLGAQLSPRTLVDVVRRLHPDAEGPYSWWSWLGRAYEKDAGWRIDYHLATPKLARAARSAVVDREHHGVRLSDHAPVVVDYDLS